MLDEEVRFGRDWVDQVALRCQVGETIVTATLCVLERTCGVAYAWLFVLAWAYVRRGVCLYT